MASSSGRKPRGTAKDRVPLYLEVDPATKTKIELIAGALNRSKALSLDMILDALVVDSHGRPSFWDGPLAEDLEQEALNIAV